ncbi:LysR family transcriptional regulator [Candidatus Methylacidithermus pantelleriae]|uniref:LysR family transcriptional regulator n=1 Tax=Candidatus Methylacidithermus pantelleriae TaxID=2744239 RepID=UPI001BD5C63A|nr:LysR family transcriptional regulator [Candidatus Methylacidithermus pantelleriae]
MQIFVAVQSVGSFTGAGKRLRLSQSSVTRAIQALESELGCRLLERSGRKVVLTAAGERLLVRARSILNEMGQARAEVSDEEGWGGKRLRIAASTTACQYILPAVFREFKESFPECMISVESADTPKGIELLEEKRVDLVLGVCPFREVDLVFHPLYQDRLVFVASSHHPLAHRATLAPEELSGLRYLLYNKSSVTFRIIQAYFERHRVRLRSFIELGNMEAIKEMVKVGLGIGVLPDWLVRQEFVKGTLIQLPFPGEVLERQWGILHRRNRSLSLAEETFLGLCRSVGQGLVQG